MSANTGHGRASFESRVVSSRAAAAALIVLFLSAAGATAYFGREAEAERSVQQLRILSQETAQQIDVGLHNVESILRAVSAQVGTRESLSDGDRASFRNRLWSSDELATLVVADETGLASAPVSTADGASKPFSIAEREFFKYWRDNPSAQGLYVAHPSKSLITGKMVVIAAIPRLTPEGKFAGVVTGALNDRYLANVLDAARVGRDGSGALLMRDATILSRAPEIDGAVGRHVPHSALSVLSGKGETFDFTVDDPSFDGRVRYVGTRRVGTRDLAVSTRCAVLPKAMRTR